MLNGNLWYVPTTRNPNDGLIPFWGQSQDGEPVLFGSLGSDFGSQWVQGLSRVARASFPVAVQR